jgi:hypothetical protein
MLWRFTNETIEDTATRMLHRQYCGEIDHTHPLDVHPAGSSVRRDLAPRECWSCRPEIELVLGV